MVFWDLLLSFLCYVAYFRYLLYDICDIATTRAEITFRVSEWCSLGARTFNLVDQSGCLVEGTADLKLSAIMVGC